MKTCSSKTPIIFALRDDALINDTPRELLNEIGFQMEEFENLPELTDSVERYKPSCILIICTDYTDKESDILAAIQKDENTPDIIIIAKNATVSSALKAMKSGASDFLDLPVNKVRFVNSVNSSIDRLNSHTDMKNQSKQIEEALQTLTAREKEILDLVGEGLSTKQIARRLNISASTVDVHRSHLMKKLEIESPAQWTHALHIFYNLKSRASRRGK